MHRFLLLLTACIVFLCASTSASAATPSNPTRSSEHPVKATQHPNVKVTDQYPIRYAPAQTATQLAGTAAAAPFLTRPYWHFHAVNSIFDHCMPTGYYQADGRICEVDGTVAVKSNGVDPYFTLGYAATPGGTNYVYYDGHNGWDMALSMDTPVLAAAAGTVTFAGWDSYGWGNTILIDHGNGFKTRYAHLDHVSVSVGEAVSRGAQIGLSGTTGNSTGPHLHFGVYRNDVTLSDGSMAAIDPWGWQASATDPWPYDEGDVWLTGNPHDPVPDAPTGVTGAVQCGSILVSWHPPAFDGGSGISSYTVTASPGGATMTVTGTQTSVLFTGLNTSTSYAFTVTAAGPVGPGPASSPSSSVIAPATTPINNSCHLYVLAGDGSLHPAGLSPAIGPNINLGKDIARSFALFPDGSGGYVLDGYGGLHPVGSAPAATPSATWPGWDIARSITLAPWSSPGTPAGWVMDGWGGIHPFGGAPKVTDATYWGGWDIARQIVVEPDSTATSVAGYTLDGWGGLHPFGGAAPVTNFAYWRGWDIAHGIALLPTSTKSVPAGYTLDGWGGIHAFGSAPAVQASSYWPGWDIARSIATWSLSPSGQPSGWVLDGWGGVHPFGTPPAVAVTAYWPGNDIARGLAGAGSGQGGRGRHS